MNSFSISEVTVEQGVIGLSPAPGRDGEYAGDLSALLAWRPTTVISLIEPHEFAKVGAVALSGDLEKAAVKQIQFSIVDFDTPSADQANELAVLEQHQLEGLAQGHRVLIHCMGGCGRSGMIALRLMIASGQHPDEALAALRTARPCAIETDAQMAWALA